jgi:hypothetical protein
MAKKKEVTVEPSAGGYRKCPDCKLSFRHEETFNQHRSLGCKPRKAKGETWSDKEPEVNQ